MIVVFDSGIWVSAMEFGGTPLEAVIRVITQDRFAVCDQIEEEIPTRPRLTSVTRRWKPSRSAALWTASITCIVRHTVEKD